jgi:nuclear cap-binding protein subunit 1
MQMPRIVSDHTGVQVVPDPSTAVGWTLRGTVLDLVHIFEVNRKESARILLSLNRYFTAGTFKSTPTAEGDDVPVSTISLESLIISTILSTMFLLPNSPCKLIYYGSVITELCKSSPNTVAPPVGRSVRKLFTLMGSAGLDIEVQRRAAQWFAIHLSNFGFQWMWKEWCVAFTTGMTGEN